MLVYFMAENFRSIDSAIELNLRAAPRMRRKSHHVRTPSINKKLKILKTGVIYGSNASGKSNVLKAIKFLKELILEYRKPNTLIKYDAFKMGNNPSKTTKFYIEFVFNQLHFGFGVELNNERILEESLFIINDSGDIPVYERKFENEKYTFEINPKFILNKSTEKELEALAYIGEFSSKNKLFITECIERNVFEQHKGFIGKYIYYYFNYHLILIFPETKYGGLIRDIKNRSKGECEYLDILSNLDTGLDDISLKKVEETSIDKELMERIKDDLNDKNSNIAFEYDGNQYQVELTEDNRYDVNKLEAIHKLPNGGEVSLSLSDESDGTKRLLDLVPALCRDSSQKHDITYIIDEFDRSLHPNLAKTFLEIFLENDDDVNRDQIIVSTHEAELLDQDLLRRDEIWFVQKERDKSSSLYSLNDYSTRFDKDIHKAYLAGKFGAIPNIVKKFKRS